MNDTPLRFIRIEDEATMLTLYEELQHGTFEYIAFDTETTGLDRFAQVFGFSVTLGSATDKEQAGKTFWYRFADYVVGTVSEERQELDKFAIEVLEWIFTKCTKRIIMHHAVFDIRLVRQSFGIEFTSPHLNDTMLLSKCLRRTNFHGLKPLAQYYLKQYTDEAQDIEAWFIQNKIKKADRNYADVPDELMYPYACADSELTYRLFFEMRKALSAVAKSVQYIYMMERELVPVVAEMEFNGMVVSVDYFTEMKAELERLQKELGSKIPVDNPNSSKQISKWLFGRDGLNLTPHAFTEAGQPKTDAKSLERYRDNPAVADYMLYSKVSHILGTFVNGILDNCVERDDGYYTIHTSYDQIIQTGRFSSSNINLQNMPNDSFSRTHGQTTGADLSIRRGFICPRDFIYVKLDYAAFELRIIGNASGDEKFNQMILDGVDMHSWLAAKLYAQELDTLKFKEEPGFYEHISEWETKSKSELSQKWGLDWKYWAVKSKATQDLKYMRTMVKICSFQVYYGSGPRTISQMHGISQKDAARLRDICFTSFQRVAQWRNEVVSYGTKNSCIYTLFGRKCVLHPAKVFTESVNYTVQGTAADLLKKAMLAAYKSIRGKLSRLITTIHDEIQLYVHKDELYLLPELIKCMEEDRLDPTKYPLPMLCEISMTTTNWAEMRDVDHLKEDVVAVAQEMLDARKD